MKTEEIIKESRCPKQREQLGIFACDGSGSMGHLDAAAEVKGKAVARATKELIQRLSGSSRKDEIYISMVAFDHQVELRLAPTQVSQIDQEMNLDPMANHGGETAIGDALNMAHQITEEFLQNEQEGLPRDAIIILMSDGCNNAGSVSPKTIAKKIKENERIIIATAAYGTDADKRLLKELSSDSDKFYCEPKTGNELRDYFLASIESIERA